MMVTEWGGWEGGRLNGVAKSEKTTKWGAKVGRVERATEWGG